MGVPGPRLTDGLRKMIREVQPGGFILFARNLESPEQTFELVAELNQLCEIPPVVTIDQEGGRVARLKSFAGEPVSGYQLALSGREDWAEQHGVLTGKLLKLFGFNLNLAPVIDYSLSEERDNSLRGRCLGRSPEEVVKMAGAFLKGMEDEGVLGTVKHFPGYTFCENDPHADLPKITRSRERMEQDELGVFKHFLKDASSVMVGHGHFTYWHEESFPASLSPTIVGDLLRKDWQYSGLVMTDDLEMGAIATRFGSADSSRRAIEAGNDMLLICHNPACALLAREELENIDSSIIELVFNRIGAFKDRLLVNPESWHEAEFAELKEKTGQLREAVCGAISV